MELKNAGFKNTDESRREAMKRMIDGEVFVIREWRIYLSPKYQKFVALHKNKPHEEKIRRWHELDEWQVEVDWKKALSPENPRWCVASGARNQGHPFYVKVIGFNEDNGAGNEYYQTVSVGWVKRAEPVSDELAALLDAEVEHE